MLAEARYATQLAIGLVFLYSGLTKLTKPIVFIRGIAEYRIIPKSLASIVGPLFIAAEIWLAFAHFRPSLTTTTLEFAIVILATLGLAVAVNLRRGRTLPCFCFGDNGENISVRTLLRLACLMICEIFLIVANRLSFPAARLPELFISVTWAMLLVVGVSWILSIGDVFELVRE
jgi:hypothetical protein